MGTAGTLTADARDAIENSRLLIGAARLLEPYAGKNCRELVLAQDIAACIEREKLFPAAVLLSGDIGFFSGAARLREMLKGYEVEAVPGVSSLVYFCSKLGVSWSDLTIVSAHGRAHNAIGEIGRSRRTFILTGPDANVSDICMMLCESGLGDVTVSAGDRLGYPEERIVTGPASYIAGLHFTGLAVMLAENSCPVEREYNAPGIADSRFARGMVPMTKQEIRTLAVSKLHILPHHILWDVGAGTGSVSVECAQAAPAGKVYSIEKNPDAIALINENKSAFGVSNLNILKGEAPQALEDLPAPDGVFLGGTAGKLNVIMELILEKNPSARIVVAAVTLETLGEAVRQFGRLQIPDTDIVQVSVTRARSVGKYHMMEAANPVWLVSGGGVSSGK